MTILKLDHVTKRFAGLVAVDNVSFEIEEGEIIGLIGANGAGKTTLFNCITGTYHNEEGSVFFNGERITGNTPAKNCKKGLARTFQIVKPFTSLSALENIMVGSLNRLNSYRKAEKHARKYLEYVGLADKENIVVQDLTIGDQRKLEMARALASEPKMLLLDEVMAGLTPTEHDAVLTLIRKVRDSGITVLMIEHIMAAVMAVSERVIVLEQGRIIATGTPDEVTRDKRVIASYLGRSYANAGEEVSESCSKSKT